MEVNKVYFDGSNRGRLVAVAHDGAEYEQSQAVCTDCGGPARVLKPLIGSAGGTKLCRCNTKN